MYPSPTHCRSRAGETGRGHGVHAGWATSEVKSGGHGACTETLWVVSALSSHAHQFPGAFMGRWGGDDGDGYDVSLASNVKALQLFLLFPRGQISTPPARIDEVAHLHVSIQGGSLQVSEQKTVLVKALELGTLVQTDKDVYKPGQTGEGQELLEELAGSWDGIPKFGSQALVLTPAPAFALSSEVSNCPFGSKPHSHQQAGEMGSGCRGGTEAIGSPHAQDDRSWQQ